MFIWCGVFFVVWVFFGLNEYGCKVYIVCCFQIVYIVFEYDVFWYGQGIVIGEEVKVFVMRFGYKFRCCYVEDVVKQIGNIQVCYDVFGMVDRVVGIDQVFVGQCFDVCCELWIWCDY